VLQGEGEDLALIIFFGMFFQKLLGGAAEKRKVRAVSEESRDSLSIPLGVGEQL
jgi:hypothetical protein